MASMAVGSAVGHNIAKTMNSAMSEINTQSPTNAVPPPLPSAYYVAVNNSATGPYTKETLKQMCEKGDFCKDTLVWKNGMAEWQKASTIEELKDIFPITPPPIPTI